MRVLIISAAILACACGRPSGLIGPIGSIAPIAPITYAVNSGDIAAAATDARVNADDHVRAAIDSQREWTEQTVNAQNDQARELVDQAKEINVERFWNAEDQKWQTYDAIKTAESTLDGASAELSPVLAKSLVGPAVVAPVAVAQPFAVAQSYAAVAPAVAQTYAVAPAAAQSYAVAPALAQSYAVAPAVAVAQPVAYSAVVKPETKTIVTQSLSQTHPAPATYVSEPIIKAAPIIEAPVIAPAFEAIVPAQKSTIEVPIVPKYEAVAPAQQTVVTQSLSQTHPAPAPVLKYAEPIFQAAPVLKYAEPIVQYAQPAIATVVQPESKSVVTSSLSQTHGSPLLSAGYVHSAAPVGYSPPIAYSAPVYNPQIVASAW